MVKKKEGRRDVRLAVVGETVTLNLVLRVDQVKVRAVDVVAEKIVNKEVESDENGISYR